MVLQIILSAARREADRQDQMLAEINDDKEINMNEKDFAALCRKTVAEYANARLDKSDGKQITEDDVFIVWMCKTLQNSKALVSTTLFDGMYYELTYNGNKQELYVDAYKKWENFTVVV